MVTKPFMLVEGKVDGETGYKGEDETEKEVAAK